MSTRLKLNNRGDTIIEVMIVLAVLGLALGISYATANRSLLNARQAQENTVATQRAQSQIEALNSLAALPNPDNNHKIFQAGPFCVNPTGNNSDPYIVQTNDDCVASGTVPYRTDVTYNQAANTFNVKLTWPDVNGESDDTVTLVYKVYKP